MKHKAFWISGEPFFDTEGGFHLRRHESIHERQDFCRGKWERAQNY
jgi:hypothetical protein